MTFDNSETYLHSCEKSHDYKYIAMKSQATPETNKKLTLIG